LLIKLKRGLYVLNKHDRKINPSLKLLANQFYFPSYVSMEYARNFYGLIPERVYQITSVSTRKTARFKNDLGEFVSPRLTGDINRLKTRMASGFLLPSRQRRLLIFSI